MVSPLLELPRLAQASLRSLDVARHLDASGAAGLVADLDHEAVTEVAPVGLADRNAGDPSRVERRRALELQVPRCPAAERSMNLGLAVAVGGLIAVSADGLRGIDTTKAAEPDAHQAVPGNVQLRAERREPAGERVARLSGCVALTETRAPFLRIAVQSPCSVRDVAVPSPAFHLVAIAALALSGAACSSSAASDAAAGDGIAGTGTATGGAGGAAGASGGAGGASCTTPSAKTPAETQYVESVQATVLDVQGLPLVRPFVQVNGTDLCVTADPPDASGHTLLTVQAELVLPRFRFGNGVSHVKFTLMVPQQRDIDFGTLRTAAFEPPSGPDLDSGETTFMSGGAVLSLLPDTLVELDPFAAGRQFLAANVPAHLAPVDPTLGFELIYGLGPLGHGVTTFCPAAQIALPNLAAWPAGTGVEFWILGQSIQEQWAPYGAWAKVVEGAVSDDGVSVATDPATGGIPVLTVVGVRKK